VVILVWTLACLNFGGLVVDRISSPSEDGTYVHRIFQPRTKPIFTILLKVVVILGSVYFLIQAWNLNLTGWLASAGVAGIAIGFAAKDTLANFFAGIFIIADSPYKIGDYIVLDNGDRGRVTYIGIRSTRMMTRDDVEVIIPNAVIGNTMIINQSGGPYEHFRLRVDLSVAYGSDIDRVREILMGIAEHNQQVVAEPAHRLRFRAFGDSGLQYQLLVWVENPEMRGQVLDTLLTDIYKAFAAEGIEIPYPKRDVYLHRVDE